MSMRKVYYGPEGIMLHHILKAYDKESLVNYAKQLRLKKLSGLKKDELVERIANELMDPAVMRRRMAVFSPEQRRLFERAMEKSFVPSEDEMEDALILHENDYAYLNRQNELHIPIDVAVAYKELNTPEFQQYAKKMSWLAACLFFAENFYGVFEKSVLLDVYNNRKGYHLTYKELEELCEDFPADRTDCHLVKGQKFIVVETLAYTEQFRELLDIQTGKVFYIPTADEVLDYSKNLYLSKEPAYERLRSFFQNEIGLTYQEADMETAEVWEKVQWDTDLPELLQYLIDVMGGTLDHRKIEKLVGLLQDANNNTRLMIHRGQTPNEILRSQMPFTKAPVVVPGSSRMAEMLQELSPDLAAMGLNVDLESNAAVVPAGNTTKKVYPNDPCPCGSGKKYKKCCGRK